MTLQEMIVANRGPLEDLAGFEIVGRATRLVLIDSLSAQIDAVQERWRMADEIFETAGNDVGITAQGIQTVPIINIFQGPHKSLLASPIDRFPNVSVTAYAVRPGTGDPMNDIHRSVEISLLVELMVAAGPITDATTSGIGDALFCESLVHRRVERTSEAVLKTIGASQNLLGTVLRIGDPRGGIVNASWVKRTDGGNEQSYVLHGARFQYSLQRLAARY